MARTQERVKKQIEEAVRGNYTQEEIIEFLLQILYPDRDLSLQQQMVGALCEVMGLDSSLNGERVAKLASSLLRADDRYTPDLIRREYGAGGGYYENHWKGLRDERPGEQEIRATILLAAQGWPGVGRAAKGSRSPV